MLTRQLGRSGIQVSAIGLGTNALGGVYWDRTGSAIDTAGYGPVDDTESLQALHRALELGITFFDTADEYGCGHSERILGQAIAGCRDQVVIATKFGYTFDESRKEITGTDASPEYIRSACEASLRRLNTGVIDLYQFHLRDYDMERAVEVRETLEDLVQEGKIRAYGWSTDDPERARLFAQGEHCAAVQHRLNIFIDNPEMVSLCEGAHLASINRIPLLMGILTGRFTPETRLPSDDYRSRVIDPSSPRVQQDLETVHQLSSILTREGHSLVQGALAWIWTRSPITIPIPGFRTVKQVEENAAAFEKGCLFPDQMDEIESLLGRK